MNYEVGMALHWTPIYWRWDSPRAVTVARAYGNGDALLSNGVIVRLDGLARIYGGGREVGRVEEAAILPPTGSPITGALEVP